MTKRNEVNEVRISASHTALFERIVSILEEARASAVRSVNSTMVVAYWLIGREIVQELQKGRQRAKYGQRLLERLSKRLINRYGDGYSIPNLRNFRQFYSVFKDRLPTIRYPVGSEPRGTRYLYRVGMFRSLNTCAKSRARFFVSHENNILTINIMALQIAWHGSC